ncbi:type I-G CRISPR-associated helicase/endonuclease Cas3g [Thiobaca trueperi]|uniref:CRISPR-associated endonuclease/helicase Cas3 n=1 Tax=Thiobaca trueperi TaxID=127458 RepID=A0A4R3N0W5_9GAMM|nr:type I-U CRISPR-associated helicase/endonuclease Cas3 [Thiobaca trueperi]TCT20663.1 CRISPR-associated endonuclease/helicase Cas3 [Thiobaca trueperi]
MQPFDAWYADRHGYSPFPWQVRLAERIARNDWPDALTPPTSSGKTAIIDVWLWARLQGVAVPRRLVYVIDRRLVVDGVTAYASALTATLPAHEQPVVVTMRGGIAIEADWLADPLRPAIIVSTVDQAGSRLLFSGYGISPRVAPIHAALLGNDALFVVDEVHLARPFLQTLSSVARQRGGALPLPWRVLPMSATWDGDNLHGLDDADWAHPLLSRRLRSSKPARLIKLKKGADLPQALAAEALKQREEGAAVIGVVCNRVAHARAVFAHLQAAGDAVLLTGRIRPADKAALTAEYLPRMAVHTRGGRDPLFVVATQTIEVGADLDFDAMVTECAPLSALRQRVGRLNRLGELTSASLTILYMPAETKTDPVYGEDIEQAWIWLNAVATGHPKAVDFGIQAMQQLIANAPPPPEAEPETPALLPAHLDLLSQTSVHHGIRIAPWLHGWESGAPDVYLCWRADWSEGSVKAAPPVRQELLAVPHHAVRRWSADIADLEGAGQSGRDADVAHVFIRWDGEDTQEISTEAVRPGDTLVLPTTIGGCDRYGWNPASREPVSDLGDTERRVRLHPALYPDLATEIRALFDSEDTTDLDWRNLAHRTGVLSGDPGRVAIYGNGPDGCVVMRATEWTSQSACRTVPLARHQQAVAERAEWFARGSGLDAELVSAVRRAGAGHDTGKQDPRWQVMVGGDGSQLLAKGPGGDTRWIALPHGWRHEMASAVLQKDPLVRYLVGAHHGHGRPLLPVAPDPALWQQLSGWAESCKALQGLYGAWGLAYLETLVRLADWSVSEAEQA